MPEIRFTCPHCQQRFDAPAEMAAQAVDCPTCHRRIRVPSAEPVVLQPPPTPKPIAGRVVAGIVGGLLVATLAANICTAVIGNPLAKTQGAGVMAVSAAVFFGLWAGAVVVALKADRAARAWRRLLIVGACLALALPLAGFVLAGKMAHHYAAKGSDIQGAMAAGAGGIAAIVMGVLGFFLGAILLVVGLLVGRDKQKGP